MPTLNPHASRERLVLYDLSFLAERFAADFPAYADRFGECERELRRFLELPIRFDGPLACMSHGVDGLWHTFVNHTPQYVPFCDAVYDKYLDHQPRSDQFPVPLEAISNFYRQYPHYFGAVPDIWFEDIPEHERDAVRRGEEPPGLLYLRWSGWPGRR